MLQMRRIRSNDTTTLNRDAKGVAPPSQTGAAPARNDRHAGGRAGANQRRYLLRATRPDNGDAGVLRPTGKVAPVGGNIVRSGQHAIGVDDRTQGVGKFIGGATGHGGVNARRRPLTTASLSSREPIVMRSAPGVPRNGKGNTNRFSRCSAAASSPARRDVTTVTKLAALGKTRRPSVDSAWESLTRSVAV